MKKSVVMLTACFFWALLSGCQSQNAKNTDELIGAIGEVGPQSGAVIAYVRDAVDVLSQVLTALRTSWRPIREA